MTIDDLLSGEKLISIAEKENKANIRHLCDLLLGIVDVFSLLLIVLPLYPNIVNGYVCSVNLWEYAQKAAYNRAVYWLLFLALILCGGLKIWLVNAKAEKGKRVLTNGSMILSVIAVLFLALAREAYAAALAFLLLVFKGWIILKSIKAGA